MTGFASDSNFSRLNVEVGAQRQPSSRVALKTSHDPGVGVEGLVNDPRHVSQMLCGEMSRRCVELLWRGVIAEVVLHIAVFVELSYESNRLLASPKSPVNGNLQAIAILRDPKR